MARDTNMIPLGGISEEARTILVKAIPYQKGGINAEDKEYFQLYNDFQIETRHKYVGDGSFNRFQTAVLGMSRKIKTLTYKGTGSYEELITKGRNE